MINSTPPIFRLIMVLVVVALFLAQLASIWPLPALDETQLPEDIVKLRQPAPKVSAQDVSIVMERPLFHENRRKAVPKKAEAVIAPQQARVEPPYTLVGVLGGAQMDRKAYLLNIKTQQTASVVAGDQIGGWTVLQVNAGSVVLELDGISRTLEISDGG